MEKNEKFNCWEFKKCSREQGVDKSSENIICPAVQSGEGNGFNGGKYRGRVCWSVAGTFCEGITQGEFAKKRKTCTECDFYLRVMEEEGEDFDILLPISNLENNI